LQLALGLKPKIIANEPNLAATGIAIIRAVRTLIATQTAIQRWSAVPTDVLAILLPQGVTL
jgi:hypothetical protein